MNLHETGQTSQSNETPNILIDQIRVRTLGELANYYIQIEPSKAGNAFVTEFFHPMSADPTVTGERLRADFVSVASSGTPVDMRLAAMTIACGYCVDVPRLLAVGERELAWLSISEARYWCGVTLASRGVEAARNETISATRKSTSRKAASQRVAQRLDSTKEEAFRLAREMKPEGQGWPSRLQATNKIKDQVVAFSALEKRQKLVDTGAVKTIYKWLSSMPDAKTLFPERPQSKKSGK